MSKHNPVTSLRHGPGALGHDGQRRSDHEEAAAVSGHTEQTIELLLKTSALLMVSGLGIWFGGIWFGISFFVLSCGKMAFSERTSVYFD